MNNFYFPKLVQFGTFCVFMWALVSCNGDKEGSFRVPDCEKSIVFKIGDLDTPEIIDGGEVHFRNQSDVDSLQLILAKGDVGKAILKTDMPRFYFDFGDGNIDSTNESLEVRHEYKVKEGEDLSTYQARLVFFDIPCEAKPIEIKVKRIKVPHVVNAKIKVNANRIYEGQSVELEEFGTGTFAWEWYEGTSMIGRGQKIKYTPTSEGVKKISCKVNNAEGTNVTVSPANIEITVIKRHQLSDLVINNKNKKKDRDDSNKNKEKDKDDPPPPPICTDSEFEKILVDMANDLNSKMNFDIDKRADFGKNVFGILDKYKKRNPLCIDKLVISKILIDDKVSEKNPVETLSNLGTQISQGADAAKAFKGSKVKAKGGKLIIEK